MNTLIHRIIRALVAPRATLSCPPSLWVRLITELNERSNGIRESGAFLLGRIDGNFRIVYNYVLYDDLDPEALKSGAVQIRSVFFGKLWDICKEHKHTVVADVHTHPGNSVAQSGTDKNNPMIAKVGHVSIILPNYGNTSNDPQFAGVYLYQGSKQWRTIQRPKSDDKIIYVGRWWR